MIEDIKSLFDTEDKRANAALQFEALKAHIGWQLVVKIVRANIAILEKELKEGRDGQTIEDVNRLRDKIKDHEHFIDTPDMMLGDLQPIQGQVPEDDPFFRE